MRTTILMTALISIVPSVAAPAQTPPVAADDPPLLSPWRTLSGHTRLVRCLAFAADGTLASGGQDRLINLWGRDGGLRRRVDLQPKGG